MSNIIRKILDAAIRRIARRHIAELNSVYFAANQRLREIAVNLTRQRDDAWAACAEREADIAGACAEWAHKVERLKTELDIERRNHGFYEQTGAEFEQALGPHPHGNGATGSWIMRARRLREERDKLREDLKYIMSRYNEEMEPFNAARKTLVDGLYDGDSNYNLQTLAAEAVKRIKTLRAEQLGLWAANKELRFENENLVARCLRMQAEILEQHDARAITDSIMRPNSLDLNAIARIAAAVSPCECDICDALER